MQGSGFKDEASDFFQDSGGSEFKDEVSGVERARFRCEG